MKNLLLALSVVAVLFSGCKKEETTTPTCTDGIQNQNETGVDCGGSCVACPSCSDSIQNGNETGIDCGGSCIACPTCSDGMQNGNETGIDCGGICNSCLCPDGYEGTDCQTLSYPKYTALNTFTSESCSPSPPFSTTNVFITWDGSYAHLIHIHNLMGSNCYDVLANIHTDVNNEGNIIEIPEQNCGGSSVEGQGTYDKVNHRLTLQLIYTVGVTQYTCTTNLQ